jgi:protein-tyrosine phosphatase
MTVLFVCLGNICRSPLAEAVFSDLVHQEGFGGRIGIDSAGTTGYHRGELADPRSRACARRHGLEITHRARMVVPSDFDVFDLLVAMDGENAAELRRLAPTVAARRKVRLLREWDPAGTGDVPDPYYGDEGDFEHVWHLCNRSSAGLLREILTWEKHKP